ncbi:MAG TPA: HAD-IIIA family hydrolase, partial [Planctomycetaceae bacterium]
MGGGRRMNVPPFSSKPVPCKPVPCIFLDRDGVLNRAIVRQGKPYPPQTLDELEVIPGVPAALAALRARGYLLIAVTNQPDVARGKQKREAVEAINARLLAELPLDRIYTSYEDGDSPRRKPNPGLLVEAAHEFGIDLAASVMVGDRWKDVEAGRRAGCRTVFIDYRYAEPVPDPAADCSVSSVLEALTWIVENIQAASSLSIPLVHDSSAA